MRIAAYLHTQPSSATSRPDPESGRYYASCVKGDRVLLLLGPFARHQEALDAVDEARSRANQLDPWAWTYGFGTVRMADDYDKPGVLAHAEARAHEERR